MSNIRLANIENLSNEAKPAFSSGGKRLLQRAVVTVAQLIVLGTSLFPMATKASQVGLASIYAYSGERTASGVWVSPASLTAAHRTLPFGTLVQVTNKSNGRSVRVRINDRGPFVSGRIIDVTPAAAHGLGFSGLTDVVLTVVGMARPYASRKHHHRTHQQQRGPTLTYRVSDDALEGHHHMRQTGSVQINSHHRNGSARRR